jgi:osmotically-inducible protein OsmY
MSDHPLERTIMQALADNPHVHADEIAVEALDGDVLVRGTVGAMLQRLEAVRTIRGVDGVRSVEDELRVRPMGAAAQADADTQAAVLAALIGDDSVRAADVNVQCRDGVVTLRGLVELAHRRDRAERVALAVPGVRRVKNHLKVLSVVSAEAVAELVTDAIGADAIVGAAQITVNVDDDVVTLTGTVRTPAEREAAVAAAAGARGVNDVHDKVRVVAPAS